MAPFEDTRAFQRGGRREAKRLQGRPVPSHRLRGTEGARRPRGGVVSFSSPSSQEGAARTNGATPVVRRILRESRAYKATLGNGFSLHSPMVAQALANLGATEDQIQGQFEFAILKNERYKLLPIEKDAGGVQINEDNWREHCTSTAEGEMAFRLFWTEQIRGRGAHQAIRRCLSELSDGVHSRLHHGVIRLAYAVQGGQEEEIAAALAAFCVNYNPLPALEGHPAPAPVHAEDTDGMDLFAEVASLLDDDPAGRRPEGVGKAWQRMMKDPEVLSRVPCVIGLSSGDGLNWLVRHAVYLYLTRPNIFTLHMVTGLHALVVLKQYYDEEDFETALECHWMSVACVFLAVKAPEIISLARARAKYPIQSWDALIDLVTSTVHGDHEIKAVDTALDMSKRFPMLSEEFELAGSIVKRFRN